MSTDLPQQKHIESTHIEAVQVTALHELVHVISYVLEQWTISNSLVCDAVDAGCLWRDGYTRVHQCVVCLDLSRPVVHSIEQDCFKFLKVSYAYDRSMTPALGHAQRCGPFYSVVHRIHAKTVIIIKIIIINNNKKNS